MPCIGQEERHGKYMPCSGMYWRSVNLKTKLLSGNFSQKNECNSLSWVEKMLRIMSFACFLGEVMAQQFCFESYWPLAQFLGKTVFVNFLTFDKSSNKSDYISVWLRLNSESCDSVDFIEKSDQCLFLLWSKELFCFLLLLHAEDRCYCQDQQDFSKLGNQPISSLLWEKLLR